MNTPPPPILLQWRIHRMASFRNGFCCFLGLRLRSTLLLLFCPFHLFIYLEFPKTQRLSAQRCRKRKRESPFHHTGSFSPAFHVTFAHLCCMLLGMGGSLCVRPWCHCWTNSNSVETWLPFIPSTALHTITPPPNRIRLSLLHEVLQKYIPLGFSLDRRARTPSVLSLW